MSPITVGLKNESWQIGEKVYVRGSAFDGHHYVTENMSQLFANIESKNQFVKRLNTINGFFAIIIQCEKTLYAAVDRIRSIPLYYGLKANHFYISDDAYWVLNQVRDKDPDLLSQIEFLMTGYVTGPNTLYPNVKQIQPGQALLIIDNQEGVCIEVDCYHTDEHRIVYSNSNHIDYQNVLDECLKNIFKRLVSLAKGRLIVVPLSAGYDSRLVILMLKELDYQNVLAYSYGRPGNKESTISERISKYLGFNWTFIEYDETCWQEWFSSKERRQFFRQASGLSSLPHIQDWPAVWLLKRRQLISKDCIFVPGHTVTLTLGGMPSKAGKEQLVSAILEKHYSLWPRTKVSADSWMRIKERVYDQVSRFSTITHEETCNAFELWECQNRQARFTVNSVRVYDFWGYSWWLPLWDAELVNLWRSMPLALRNRKLVYANYVEHLSAALGLAPEGINKKQDIVSNSKRFINWTPLYPLLSFVYRQYCYSQKKRRDYDNHPLGWYGIVSRERFRKLYSGRENLNSFMVLEYLDEMSSNLPSILEEV